MAKAKADISIDLGTESENVLQRMGELNSILATLEEHDAAIKEMGYELSISKSNGEFVVTLTDATTA